MAEKIIDDQDFFAPIRREESKKENKEIVALGQRRVEGHGALVITPGQFNKLLNIHEFSVEAPNELFPKIDWRQSKSTIQKLDLNF